jgi:hypothetical protein
MEQERNHAIETRKKAAATRGRKEDSVSPCVAKPMNGTRAMARISSRMRLLLGYLAFKNVFTLLGQPY